MPESFIHYSSYDEPGTGVCRCAVPRQIVIGNPARIAAPLRDRQD
jgi:hypothetical protein